MPVAHRLSSLREVSEVAAESGEFGFALKDFLDGFYACPEPASLADEPPCLASILPDGERLDAYLAAVAEHLCGRHRWPVPSWARDASRYLETPWFGMQSHGGRMVLLEESPSAFRVRNIFVSGNALSRA
jgi:hypothetical protein